jgi:putative FmdB family regulatory protein
MTYEYACTACGHAWEAEQSISAAPLTECPNCHHATAKRQVSGGAGFILKGGGWYADLYSSGGAKKNEKSEKSESASEGAAASSKESKPKTDASSTSSTQAADSSSKPSAPSTPAKGPATGAASS